MNREYAVIDGREATLGNICVTLENGETYCRLIMQVRANIALATELVLIKQWPPTNWI